MSRVMPSRMIWVFTLLSIMFCQHAIAGARVFLLAGQSNMAGAGYFEKLEAPYNKPLAGVKVWTKQGWGDLGPGISAGKGRFGPEIAFGHAIKKAYPDDDIYLIKVAAGGTSLYHSWALPGEDAPPKSGGMYMMFIARSKTALKNLDAAEIQYTIGGMLWMQGESDAKGGKGAAYKANLTAFIKHMRAHFKAEKLPFILGRIITHFDTPEGDNALVRAAQESVAKDLENVAWFDTDDYEKINAGHYNHKGLIRMGRDFAAGLLTVVEAAEQAEKASE